MGKPFRKPRPAPPKWYWWDSDNCWACRNRNNCNQCKWLKRLNAQQKKKRRQNDSTRQQEYEN